MSAALACSHFSCFQERSTKDSCAGIPRVRRNITCNYLNLEDIGKNTPYVSIVSVIDRDEFDTMILKHSHLGTCCTSPMLEVLINLSPKTTHSGESNFLENSSKVNPRFRYQSYLWNIDELPRREATI